VLRAHYFIISGQVQGVGFRYFTKIHAQTLGICGLVRNMNDGSVEVTAVGNDTIINKFLAMLQKGSRYSNIIGIMKNEIEIDRIYNSFEIR